MKNLIYITLLQIWNYILNSRYPCIETWSYWEWHWDSNGNVKFNHLKTLKKYLSNYGKKI